MRLGWKNFGGIIPKCAPRNLPEQAAQISRNSWLAENALEPIKEPLVVTTVPAGSKSIYLWRRGGSSEWLSWLIDVDVAQGPIADDQYSRIYFTDGTTLHMNLWNNNAKVEVTDVSMPAPPVLAIAKSNLFSPSACQAFIGDLALTYKGYKWEDNTLSLMFHQAPNTFPTTQFLTDSYYLKIPTESMAPNALTTLPSGTALYATEVDLKTNAIKFGTFQCLNVAFKQTSEYFTRAINSSQTETYYGADVTFTCQIVTKRTNTQYQYYVCTRVDPYGQESPPSDVSEEIEWGVNDQLQITIPGYATPGHKMRIYRSATGQLDSKFFFLTEKTLTGSTQIFIDDKSDAELAEVMPQIENPPIAMSGLVNVPGGFFAAFHEKDLYFSEPYLPYSWPTRYRLTMDYDIVGLAVSGNDLLVLTTGNPYYISGTHPEILTQTKLPIQQSCVAKRSIAFAGTFVCYASPDGLCTITGGQVRVITFPFYTRDQWQALNPELMVGSVHDGRYIAFTDVMGLIIDFQENRSTLSTTDQLATAQYADLLNDQLYLVQDTNITDWRAGANNLVATWKSKEFQNVQDAIWTSAKVIADSYNSVTFKIYSEGVLVWSKTVLDETGFRVPKFDRAGRWSIQIDTEDRVCEVLLASSMTLLRSGDGIKQ